ncbi:MAG: S41 family peptidase [Candidatus Microsaccharimonas sp.]
MAEPKNTHDAPRRNKSVNQRRVPTALMVLGFIFVAGIGYVAGVINTGGYVSTGFNALLGKQDLNTASLQATYRALQDNFDGQLDTQKLIEGANKGLVDAAGDQYTVYMNANESKEFNNSLTGNIGGGIGVEVGMRNAVPTAVRVLQNNPAEKAGLQINDNIIKVNDESTENLTLDEVVSKIRGEAGTTVKLTVNRGGEEKEFNITRAEVNNPSAYGEVKDGVGVLTITRFDDNTASLAREVARSFKQQNVKAVVLDLRGNGGGYVTAAQAVAGIWLDNQLVTTERQNGRVTEELKSTGSPILNGVPTVVLVNASSASASEIVAGALHDHKVARLMGETTFGKGSVQKLVNLSDGAMLKVTVARWFTPAGVNISEKGIAPDTEVKRTADDINANRDPQLDAALQSL